MAQKKTIIVQEPATLSAKSSLTQSQANLMKAAQQARQAEAVQLAQAQAAKKTNTTTSAAKPASNPPATSQFSTKVNVGQATTTPKNASTTLPTVSVVDTMPARTISTPSAATTTTVYTGKSLDVAPTQNTENKGSNGGGNQTYTPPADNVPTVATTPTEVSASPSVSVSSGSSSGNSYPSSSYSPAYTQPTVAKFTPSAEYYEAMDQTKRLLEELRGGRTSYSDRLDAALKAIEDNPAFKYDFNTDPLFQNYLASAMRSGQTAMQDTMGQAAALTGGYGSSYAQRVGNQAYNDTIAGAYENLPEYANLALEEYQTDLNNKYELLDAMRVGDATEYERKYNDFENQFRMANDQYQKEYDNYWQEQGFNEESRRWASEFNDEMDRFKESIRQYDNDFNERIREYDTDDAYRKERAARSDYEWDTSFDYQKYRDGVSDSHWKKNYDLSASKSSNAGTQDDAYKKFSTISSEAEYMAKNKTEEAYWAWADKMVDQGYDPNDLDNTWTVYGVTANNTKTPKDNPQYSLNRDGLFVDSSTGKLVSDAGHLQEVEFYPTDRKDVYMDKYGTLYTLKQIQEMGLTHRIKA